MSRYLADISIRSSGTLLRLKGAILRMALLDATGALLPGPSEPWREPDCANDKERARKRRTASPPGSQEAGEMQFAVICSDKQAKVIALPSQAVAFKHNITETSFVLRSDVVQMSGGVCIACFCANGHIMTLR